MVNEGLIACVEKYTPKEVAEALIHSFKSDDLNKVITIVDDYVKNYSNDK